MPGTFSPAADFKGNRKLAIQACRDAGRDRLPAVTGKTFPAIPAHAHPQFCVSGKRPIVIPQPGPDLHTEIYDPGPWGQLRDFGQFDHSTCHKSQEWRQVINTESV